MQKVGQGLRFGSEVLGELRDMRNRQKLDNPDSSATQNGKSSFIDHLKEAVDEVNQSQITADKKATDLATGKETNIHDTMLSATQAELSFNLMVQVRNKALEAYQEIMRMPV
jgi:flagellar hook-basal body complex protein FliE